MRKISIRIFAVITVILFILSTSISVTAATHREITMVLDSRVREDSPRASVNMTPQNVWDMDNWTWTPDINNGDDVIIDTTCDWLNANLFQNNSGYHYYYVDASYVKGLDVKQDDDDHTEWTDGSVGGIPEQGSTTITVEFYDVDEGGTIDIYWLVQAINYKPTPRVEAHEQHTGTIYLT